MRSIGKADDNAGHVIGAQFGGTNRFDQSPDGNLFPQHGPTNQIEVMTYEGKTRRLHEQGNDVCVVIYLYYDSLTATRPSAVTHARMVRKPGGKFKWEVPETFLNP